MVVVRLPFKLEAKTREEKETEEKKAEEKKTEERWKRTSMVVDGNEGWRGVADHKYEYGNCPL